MPTAIGTSPAEVRQCPLRSRAGKEGGGKGEEEKTPPKESNNSHCAGGENDLKLNVCF